MFRQLISIILAALMLAPVHVAAQGERDPQMTHAMRAEVVEALASALRENYVFPDTAETVAVELTERINSGTYDSATTASSFADALNEDLRSVGNDRHFRLLYAPNRPSRQRRGDGGPPTAEQVEQEEERTARYGFGIAGVRRMPGNIGYMDVRAFMRPEFVAPAYEAAMKLLSGSDAVIVDLRSNGGGDPQSVAQLMSHFFARGDERHINSIYNRPRDQTREFWTNPTVETRYTGTVYILTSGYTFSGGEEFAYDMQTQERGTLIGETTGGGANPGGSVPLAHGFVAFVPSGRAINPVTGTNWEHVGVKPDRDVPATEALASAYKSAIEASIESEADERRKSRLQGILSDIETGDAGLPKWKDPRAGR